MISAADREKAVELIDEAVINGARRYKACNEIGIDVRTYYRWTGKKKSGDISDNRPGSVHPAPANKLSKEERKQVIETVNEPRFTSKPPCEIVPTLADEGTYIASESTIYRILREEKMQNHRGRAAEPSGKKPTTFVATAPNQVWMWDITYLHGPHKGFFYYLYLFIDLFSRDVVAWDVYEEENAELAAEVVRRACFAQHHLSTEPLVLHSDNGSPMKGATMLETLYRLGITPSNSRPRVSNDNPYAESVFKTLKYRPNYQPKGFSSLEEARKWCADFVKWYSYEHHHSGIKFLTPHEVHEGKGEAVLARRHKVYEAAKAKHPERWNGRKTRDWSMFTEVFLNPENAAFDKAETREITPGKQQKNTA